MRPNCWQGRAVLGGGRRSGLARALLMCAALGAVGASLGCPTGTTGDEGAALVALLGLQPQGAAPGTVNQCAGKSASTPSGTAAADTVTSAPGATGEGFADSRCLTNGVRGLGATQGSLDVYTLGASGSAASVVLEWSGKKVTNGSGIDFVVFENAFVLNGSAQTVFMEAIVVEVSRDNSAYCGFAPDYTNTPETTYSQDPSKWTNFAGRTPVQYNQETNALNSTDLFDASRAGGDGFDLSNLSASNAFGTGCSAAVQGDIQTNGFVYVRLTSATARSNPDTGAAYVQDPGALGNGPDVDGVVARYMQDR